MLAESSYAAIHSETGALCGSTQEQVRKTLSRQPTSVGYHAGRSQTCTLDYCCHNCFEDQFLIEKIKRDGKVEKCSLCNERKKCLDVEALQNIFSPLVNLYTNVEEFLPTEMLKDSAGEHSSLAEKISSDWFVFSGEEQAARFLELCQEHRTRDDMYDKFDPTRSVDNEEYFYFGEYERSSSLKGTSKNPRPAGFGN